MNPRFKTSAALPVSKTLFIAFALLLLASAAASTANAQDRNRRAGRFEISTTPGGYPVFIDGQPRGTTSTTVQLYDVEPGAHTVEIRFPNNTTWRRDFTIAPSKRQCIVLNFRPKTVTIERPVAVKSPCPYPVNISAPASVREGDQVTFSADVDYAGQSGLNYTWTISPPSARIAQGAGTPTITVDTTGVGNQRVTAILVVDDGSGDRNCRQRAQFATNVTALPQIPRPAGRQFAEFPSVAFNEDKANFDNFAVALQEDPTATGYVIVYNGRRSRPARLTTLVNRSRDYVVNTRNIDRSRVVVMNGGTREVDTIELWIVPQGATPPRPTPR
ncbi:MAG TPA: PEGA domain-containing protein [Pyrinomonadaceae bacterium]